MLEGAVRGDHLDIVKAYAGRPDTLGDAGYYFTNAQSLAVAQALYDAGLRPRSISIFATLGRRVVNLDIINFYLDVFDIATLAPVMDFATMSIPIVERVKYHLSGIHRFRPVANLKYLIGKCIVCATGLDLLKAVLEHPNIQRYRPYELLPKVLDDYIERDAVKDPDFIARMWEYIDSKRQ